MRQARADDHWRRLLDKSRQRKLSLKALSFVDGKGVGTCSVELHPALTVICGANGAGKSTLLSICALTYAFETVDSRIKMKFADLCSWIELSIPRTANGPVYVELNSGKHIKPDGVDAEFHKLDVAEEWFRIKDLADHEKNWDELLEQTPFKELKEPDLLCLRYLTGKSYTGCQVYEIEDFDNVMAGRFPYFLVTCDGTSYSMSEMGTGEGALFLIWWKLSQIRFPGILLLEEPDTHITARSQRALMDLIAEKCTKDLCCIITTHSPTLIEYVPDVCRRLIVRFQNNVSVRDCPDESQLQIAIGVTVEPVVTVLVEDRCAKLVVNEVMRYFQQDLSSRMHVAIGGGESEVVQVFKNLPRNCPGPKLVGVLDGDMKNQYGIDLSATAYIPEGFKHPLEYLPWNVAPDMFLREFSASNSNEIAAALKLSHFRMTTIFSALQGVDHHDWCDQLAQHASKSYDETVGALLQVVLADPVQRKECESFASRMAMLVSKLCNSSEE